MRVMLNNRDFILLKGCSNRVPFNLGQSIFLSDIVY